MEVNNGSESCAAEVASINSNYVLSLCCQFRLTHYSQHYTNQPPNSLTSQSNSVDYSFSLKWSHLKICISLCLWFLKLNFKFCCWVKILNIFGMRLLFVCKAKEVLRHKLWLLRNFGFYSHLSVNITKDICKMSFLASAQKDDKKWFISLNICFVNEPKFPIQQLFLAFKDNYLQL